jgi:molybdate transport system substrate-binding protein
MKKRGHASINLVLVIAGVAAVLSALAGLAWPAAARAQGQGQPESRKQTRTLLNVITSGGFAAAFQEMQPEFEKSTGIKLTVTRGASQGSGPDTIGAQLRRGMAADVVIMSREGLDDLIAEKRIVAGSDLNLGQTPLGMAVRAGAPKPDISTVEAFKKTMLRAKSVTFPGSTTGIYMVKKLFPQLGIASEMAPKTTSTGVAAVAKGDAEIAVQPVSELLHVPGTEFVGTLPKEIQYVSVFSAAMVAGSKEPKAVLATRALEARKLLDFLTSEKAKAAIKASGMEPVKAR